MSLPINVSDLKEIKIKIHHDGTTYYGGSQDWYPSKAHQMSGCGPVAAANMTAYLAQLLPDRFGALYPYATTGFDKKNYIDHMVQIRKYVKPGIFGLTSVQQFSSNVLEFAQKQHVNLTPHFVKEGCTADEAIEFILSALSKDLPVAILILTHPVREFSEFVWHWMTITHFHTNKLTSKRSIVTSSYGERFTLDFDLLWNKRRAKDIIRLIYFD